MCSGAFLLCLVRIAAFYKGHYAAGTICKRIQLLLAPDSRCWGVLFFQSAFSCLQHLLSVWPYYGMETRESCIENSCLDPDWSCLRVSSSSSPSRDLFGQQGGESPPAHLEHERLRCAGEVFPGAEWGLFKLKWGDFLENVSFWVFLSKKRWLLF